MVFIGEWVTLDTGHYTRKKVKKNKNENFKKRIKMEERKEEQLTDKYQLSNEQRSKTDKAQSS